jgi:hypothetical protein
MAAWITIEEESGTSRYQVHPHNGYYAGDFSLAGHGGQARSGHDGDSPTMRDLVLVTGKRLQVW